MGEKEEKEVIEERVGYLTEVDDVTETKKDLPMLKRFSTYDEAFNYFLSIINGKILIQGSPNDYSKVKRRLRDIVEMTLKYTHIGKVPNEDIEAHTNWKTIDFNIRLIIEKKSTLSKSYRDFVMELFEWVDHFVDPKAKGSTELLNDVIQGVDSINENN